MQFHEYETIIIIRPDLDDADTDAIVEKIEAIVVAGGRLLDREDWGKKRLAYPINKHQKGHYVLYNFLAEAPLISELERVIRITDNVVRFLTIRKAEAVDVETRIQQASETRRVRLEEEAKRAEEEAKRAAEAAKYAAAEAVARAAEQEANKKAEEAAAAAETADEGADASA